MTFPPAHGSSPTSIASFPPLSVVTLFALAAQPSLPVRAGPMIAFRLSATGPLMLSSFTSRSILCSCRPSPLLHLHCLPPETLPFLSLPPASLPPPHLPLPSHTVQVSVMLSRNVIQVAPGQPWCAFLPCSPGQGRNRLPQTQLVRRNSRQERPSARDLLTAVHHPGEQ